MKPTAAATLSVEEHLSPERLALLLGCSTSKIRKAIWRQELRAVHVGRLVRIPASSVERWLQACRPARREAQ
jgi:excisionase family DNA binding protein